MKTVKIYSKVIDTALDGRKCTPCELVWFYHGNILFKKGFVKRLFNYTGTCLHVLGFRLTKSIITF
jgi:hypothetical protein